MLLSATSAPVNASQGTTGIRAPKPAEIDAIFRDYDRRDSAGCSLAVEHKGEIVYAKGYGMANLEYGIANSPDTVFHIASVSKQVTAFAIQLLVEERRIKLDDDVRMYVPELHDFGKVITLSHLMHHTSGLRDQWDLLAMGAWRMDDVITEDDILRLLFRQKSLNVDPGTRFIYCNSGYTLLGLVVERVTGKTLREFCQERIFGPLGMKHTHFHDDYKEIVENRAYSYYPTDGGGTEAAILSFSNVGATGLFSTVADFTRWSRNLVAPTVGNRAVVDRMAATSPLNDGRASQYASGIIVGHYRGLRVMEHLGSDAGYRSECIVFPDHEFSVICFANTGSADLAALARRVVDLFLADALGPVAKAAETGAVDPGAAAKFAGTYAFDPGMVGTFAVSEGKFEVRIGGDGPIEVFALPGNEFRIPGIGKCRFIKRKIGYDCRLTNADVDEVGHPLARVPPSQELSAFVGEFYSDELQAFCRIRLDGDGMKLELTKRTEDLKPLARDTFGFGPRIMRFERNRRGAVVRLFISTSRSFNVRFERWTS